MAERRADRSPNARRLRRRYLRVARGTRDGGAQAGPPTGSGRVVVIGATVGQGHEGAARELSRRLSLHGVDVATYDYLDAVPAAARRVLRDLYAPTVQHAPAVFDGVFRALEHPGTVRRVTEGICTSAEPAILRWSAGADVVVSTYPLGGRTLGELRRSGRLGATAVTYLTDPAAHALWCHPDVDLHLTVTRATARDAGRYGVHAVASGPLCAPGFREQVDRAGARPGVRADLALPPDVPVALLSAGSLGMGDVPRTIDAILHHPTACVLVLCGRNDVLRRRLGGDPRVTALGWRDDVPDLMTAADVLVHNAGGLSLTEALVAGLPAVTYLPIPGHGRANATVLQESGLAPWPRDPAALAAAIDRAHRTRVVGAGPGALSLWPAGADPVDAVRAVLGPPDPDERSVVGL
ncbi:glycosyltransferase [Pseudonocardia endophytica]|nr:glycosyltransferase [Pseudonocardia endophytica]